jgi:hypothetical protein
MLIFLDAKENGIFDDGLRFGKLRAAINSPLRRRRKLAKPETCC